MEKRNYLKLDEIDGTHIGFVGFESDEELNEKVKMAIVDHFNLESVDSINEIDELKFATYKYGRPDQFDVSFFDDEELLAYTIYVEQAILY